MNPKNYNKNNRKFIQGLRSFKDILPSKIKNLINKKGQIYSETLDNWRYFVGNDLFDISFPKSLKNENKLVKIKKRNLKAPFVIIAGGKGTRLKPFTDILPKPLIPIGKTTLIENILDNSIEKGVKNFYLILNYMHNTIQSYFSERSKKYNIHFVVEKKALNTAGGLRLLKKKIKTDFFLINCDTLINIDYFYLIFVNFTLNR